MRIKFTIIGLLCFVGLSAQTFHAFNAFPIDPILGEEDTLCSFAIFLMENNANDEQENVTMTLQGTATYSSSTPEQGSYYLDLNGSGRYADLSSINFGDHFTIAFLWRKGSFGSGYPILFDGFDSNDGFHIDIDESNSRYRVYTGNGLNTDWAYSTTQTFNTNTWYYLVVVFDRENGDVTFYHDGSDVTAVDNSTRTDYANNKAVEVGSTTIYCYANIDALHISLFEWSQSNVTDFNNTPGSEVCE